MEVRLGRADHARDLREIATALTETPRRLPSRFFYDDLGSQLFDEITRLPEYYPTRAEAALLNRVADRIAAETGVGELVEIGAGTATKTRRLLDAFAARGTLRRYIPLDVSEAELRRTALALTDEYPQLAVHAVVDDFSAGHLHGLGSSDALVLFLGSTLGNFEPTAATELLGRIAAAMSPGGYFLLGVDLVKPVDLLEAAYNDSAGVTAEFNRNILRVVNRVTHGDFEPSSFVHRAIWEPEEERIEMRLASPDSQVVRLDELALEIRLERGEEILTEISSKYRRPGVESMLEAVGLTLCDWFEELDTFALALARRAPE
ncbi:MAG: L-histidine N(alpha)-methyltransferase [Thermoanaerobaculia bacterium]|nr:L-histidine N(alpha)-methyltransferase [Thermoanaerobaculia bacterium]